ncbi:MAG: TPR repeat protein [Gammaproteobacteria bacterium]|jgi:TPR repeat protein
MREDSRVHEMKRLVLALVLLWPVSGLADLAAGFEAVQRGDYANAMREWRPLAEQGNAKAQHNLGWIFANGKGVPQNNNEAIKWYRLAAEQGNAGAQYNLALMYYEGHGVPANYAEAVKWFRLAAEQGDADAQNNLATAYLNGKGVPEDYVHSYAWLNMSAAQGNKLASLKKSILRERMTPAQIAEAQKLSRELCAKIPNCAK